MKRFYTAATITGAAAPFGIALDKRPVRTPARELLSLPTRALAGAIADEWNSQGEQVLPRTMPLTGLSNAAIDRVAADPAGFADGLARFAENELLTYRADAPAPLVALQAAHWDPWLGWARQRYDVDFTIVTGIIHRAQPPETLARIANAYRAFDAFRLAALNPVVTISGSAIIGLAVASDVMDAETAWSIGHLDELWQAEQWGKDPLAEAGHNERRGDLAAAVRMLRLLAD
ncbi:MAG: ATPase [Sandarakinorhabdus sp.]|nr:ATPase [Sandarakinorhabdus sp.]